MNNSNKYVVDGQNVSCCHGNGKFSFSILKKAASSMNQLGTSGLFVLPSYRIQKLKENDRLKEFKKALQDLGSSLIETACDDDETVICISHQLGVPILSNDYYRKEIDKINDLIYKKTLKEYVESNRKGFVWADDELVIVDMKVRSS